MGADTIQFSGLYQAYLPGHQSQTNCPWRKLCCLAREGHWISRWLTQNKGQFGLSEDVCLWGRRYETFFIKYNFFWKDIRSDIRQTTGGTAARPFLKNEFYWHLLSSRQHLSRKCNTWEVKCNVRGKTDNLKPFYEERKTKVINLSRQR